MTFNKDAIVERGASEYGKYFGYECGAAFQDLRPAESALDCDVVQWQSVAVCAVVAVGVVEA